MKPTISNAFTNGTNPTAARRAKPAPGTTGTAGTSESAGPIRRSTRQWHSVNETRSPLKSLAASLASMQADLRETEFGWSLELTPMSTIDALGALAEGAPNQTELQYLVSMEQSAWRDGETDLPLARIAKRLCIDPIETISDEQLVLGETALRQLVSLCQPTRLLVVAIEGAVDGRDATAMNRAIDAGHSPLLGELRATFALEVLGDRNIVLHSRSRQTALALVADNFRHYLSALTNKAATRYSAPFDWQIERLLDETGVLTIRPIETDVMATSIDVGVNTSRERFDKPANRSLIYDVVSDTWHDEP